MAAGPFGLRNFVAVVALGATLLGAAFPATAASSRVCRQLEAELAATYGPRASSAPARKHDAAIGKQRNQIQLARKQSRQAGCGFPLFGRGNSKCGSLNNKIDKMERNLDALQRKRGQLAGGSSRNARARILASIDANRCRGRVAERRSPDGVEGSRNLLRQIFGGAIRDRAIDEDLGTREPVRRDADKGSREIKPRQGSWVNDGGHIRFVAPPGNYRTLCVRTCDGYFFPMSSSSSPMHFDRDQKNCESSCPGTDIQLYYHRSKGEESQDMISPGSGAPYSELPTAYLYKQIGSPRPANCGCNRRQNYNVVAGRPTTDGAPENEPASISSSIISLGTPAPEAKKADKPAALPATEREETAKDRSVRAVGPTFLPDPESAIDLQAPAQTQVR